MRRGRKGGREGAEGGREGGRKEEGGVGGMLLADVVEEEPSPWSQCPICGPERSRLVLAEIEDSVGDDHVGDALLNGRGVRL